jgi:perosamine synthetase
MSDVPIADPRLGNAEKRRVRAVIDDGQIADGPEVRRFEAEFAAYCDTDAAVATSNGTTALHAALRAVGIGQDDVVVTTPFSFVATANAIRHCGATPVFADIDSTTSNIDPESVEAVIRERDGDVDALLPVHLYGLPADMDSLLQLADQWDLAVVEDAAQAHGAHSSGRPVGSMGDAGTFSFYPTKNMTTGEGGMIVTDSDDVAARARRFVDHGRDHLDRGRSTGPEDEADTPPDGPEDGTEGPAHVELGHNFRMTSIAAAIGRVQLDRLPGFIRRRRENAAALTEGLASVPGIEVPTEPPDRRHVYHQYTVRCTDRPATRKALGEAGIESAVYYPTPIHKEPAYDDLASQPGAASPISLPVTEAAASSVLSLPVHPSLTPGGVEAVVDALRQTASPEGV